MAVQKTNPLPNGFYWIDLFSPTSSSPTTKEQPPIFFAWVNANRARVLVRRSEEFPEPALGGPKRTWVLFEVTGPPGAFPFGLGFPNITTNPDEPSFYSELPTTPDFGDWLQGGANTLVALALIYILMTQRKART